MAKKTKKEEDGTKKAIANERRIERFDVAICDFKTFLG